MPRRAEFPTDPTEHDLAALSDQQRLCHYLYVEQRLATRAIATRLRISRQTVERHLEVALAKLRGEFIPRQRALSLDSALDDGLDERAIRAWV